MVEHPAVRALHLLEVGDQHDAVADGDAEDGDEPDDRAERELPAARQQDGGEPAHERERHVHHGERGEPRRAEVEDEKDEDAEQREDAEADEPLARRRGGRVLAAHLGVDARRQCGRRHGAADVARHGVERSTAGVEAHENGAHAVLVHDRRAQRRDLDVGDGAERHDPSLRRHQRQPGEALGVGGRVGGDAEDDVGLALALEEAPDRHAPEGAAHRALDGGRRHAVLQEIVAARVDAQAGRGERPGRVEIHHAGDRRDPLAQRGGRLLEARQLQPAQPDDQLGAGAAEQLLDAFVQELLDVEGEAGHAAGLLPERLGHRLRIDVGCELHHHLAALGAPDVLREGRAADHLRHRAHAGDGEEAPAHLGAHPDRLREAHPRRTGHVHHEVRLVELGQELEVRERAQADGHCDGREAAGEDGRRAGEHAGERPLVAAAERRHEPWRLRMARDGAREQHERQRRRHRERDAERGERRQHVGERQRAEQRALEAAEQEDRQEHERHHDRRVDDGAAHLHRGGEHDVEGAGAGGRAAQPPPGVLDVDDRVVHHLPDGDREAAEHHDVEGRARRAQHGHGREQRERDGDHAHHRRPQLGGEDQEHERYQDGAGQERAAQVAKGVRHEARLAEHRPLDAHVGGQRAHDRLERVLDRRGDGQHVLLGLLGDEQHDAGLAVHDRVAHRHRRPVRHVGDARERHRDVIPTRERRLCEVGGAVQPAVEPGG